MPLPNNVKATPSQQQYVLALMRAQELPTRRVTVMHRLIFGRTNVPWKDGQKMDELLASLDQRQVDALVNDLRDDDQEEDD